tara:strand:+ start:302 stop:568 length:267 start_codon:yes stop_codon:yes gene_type:complete
MGKVKKNLKLQPGDLIISLDDEEVGVLVEQQEVAGLLKTNKPKRKVWIINWVKGGTRAAQVWGAIHHNEEDLIEDIWSGYWTLYRALN